MADIDDFAHVAGPEGGLVVVSTTRGDGSIQSSVVNAGVLDHPTTGRPVVGFVAVGGSRKVANLRARPQATIVARTGFQWLTVEGTAELIGPDDLPSGFDRETLRLLLREVFAAAGGTHDDWDSYDRVMADERRTAVLVTPTRVYSNG
jgi:PPOX class probable F420-dependent enzyme